MVRIKCCDSIWLYGELGAGDDSSADEEIIQPAVLDPETQGWLATCIAAHPQYIYVGTAKAQDEEDGMSTFVVRCVAGTNAIWASRGCS